MNPTMNPKMKWLYVSLAVLLLLTGVVVYKAVSGSRTAPAPAEEEEILEALPQADAAVTVEAVKSKVKDNTVVLTVNGLGGNYAMLSYELSYESQGIVQGVTSQPIDISGKDSFIRDDIYLGTCSRNVCRPHAGVTEVAVVIAFTDTDGKRSQFSQEYAL